MKVYKIEEFKNGQEFEEKANLLAAGGFELNSWRDGDDPDEIYSILAVFVKEQDSNVRSN